MRKQIDFFPIKKTQKEEMETYMYPYQPFNHPSTPMHCMHYTYTVTRYPFYPIILYPSLISQEAHPLLHVIILPLTTAVHSLIYSLRIPCSSGPHGPSLFALHYDNYCSYLIMYS